MMPFPGSNTATPSGVQCLSKVRFMTILLW